MLSRRTFLASTLIAALLATGCIRQAAKEIAQTLNELAPVRNELLKQFGDEVNVTLNQNWSGRALTIMFINSSLNDRTPNDRLARAYQTARIAKARYVQSEQLNTIWIGFARVKTRLLIFHESEVFDGYSFDKEAKLRQPREYVGGVTGSGVQLETTAGYMSNTDETDVSVSGIQLDGMPGGLGITVLPHFRVNGDTREGPAPPPATVSFDFASYSETPRFKQVTPIFFIADGKPVVNAQGTFTGNNAQFCYLPVSYSAFRRLLGANELTIRIEDKDYPLTPPQFAALKRMNDYVQP